jgi:uncharacterized membrane protein YdjX (TVP38/TMEM64 family)
MSHKTLIKLAALLLIIILFASIELFVPGFYGTLVTLAGNRDMPGIAAYIASFGYTAMGIAILLIIVTNTTGLPSIEILTASGLIFGIVPGIILSWIGEVLGNIVSFLVIRLLFRDAAHDFIAKNKSLKKLDSYSNFREMLVARLIPFSPNVLITTLGALSHLSFRDHTIATIIGKLPSVALEVWLGHDLLKLAGGGHWKTLGIITVVVLIIAFIIYLRKRNKQA